MQRYRHALSSRRTRFFQFQAEAFPLDGRRQGGDHHVEPAGAEESADVRVLCRAARHCSAISSYADDIKNVVITGAGGNFCSGGDVHEIIGPLVEMQRKDDMAGLLAFTRMTGDLVKAMRACPQPIVAAIDGICAGAGAIIAMASDLRVGTARSKVGVPVRPRRARRRRHGRLRDPAAHHRPRPRLGAALHRPLHGRHRGRALGLLQQAVRAGDGARRRAGAGQDTCRTARPSPTP